MSSITLVEINQAYWDEIKKKCNKAVVFIENAASECLHWCGGLKVLSSAAQVREFSPFESAQPAFKKAVFIVGNPALKSSERTLKAIIEASKFEFVSVISWCHPHVLTVAKYPVKDFNVDDRGGVEWLEDSLLHWMGNINYTAQVLYYPIFMVVVCSKAFYTPAYTRLFPLLADDVTKCAALWKLLHPAQSLPQTDGTDWQLFPQELQTVIRQLVANIHSLLSSLGIKEDIWSVGPFAKAVGDQLESWGPARNRRKAAQQQQGGLSLILVDRTLDLAGPIISSGESVMGKILESHAKLPGHNLDVCVDLSELLGVRCAKMLPPASLANSGLGSDESAELEVLFLAQEKEAVQLLHSNLVKNSPRKSDSGRKKSLPTSALAANLKEYDMDYEAIYSHLSTVSRTKAWLNTQDSEQQVKRKKLESLSGQLGRELLAGRGGGNVLAELTHLVYSRADSRLSLGDIVRLLVFVYSAAHPNTSFREDDEERLKSVLGEALLVEGKSGNLDPLLVAVFQREGAGQMDELVALKVVNYIWSRLEGLLSYRSQIPHYSELLDSEGRYLGVLEQLLEDVYDEKRPEVASLHHHSGGLWGSVKSGFGWLGGVAAKQHPRQNPWVIVFVLGGVSPGEIKQLQGMVSGTESRLTVAGTGILSSLDILELLLLSDPLHTAI